jgi:hypothetical protein
MTYFALARIHVTRLCTGVRKWGKLVHVGVKMLEPGPDLRHSRIDNLRTSPVHARTHTGCTPLYTRYDTRMHSHHTPHTCSPRQPYAPDTVPTQYRLTLQDVISSQTSRHHNLDFSESLLSTGTGMEVMMRYIVINYLDQKYKPTKYTAARGTIAASCDVCHWDSRSSQTPPRQCSLFTLPTIATPPPTRTHTTSTHTSYHSSELCCLPRGQSQLAQATHVLLAVHSAGAYPHKAVGGGRAMYNAGGRGRAMHKAVGVAHEEGNQW